MAKQVHIDPVRASIVDLRKRMMHLEQDVVDELGSQHTDVRALQDRVAALETKEAPPVPWYRRLITAMKGEHDGNHS